MTRPGNNTPGCHSTICAGATVDGRVMEIGTGRLREFGGHYTEAWCSQDPARVAEFFSPDGSLTINGGRAAVGREAIREVVEGFMIAFPDLVLTMDEVHVEGDGAAYHWTFEGTNTGTGGKGQPVSIRGFVEWVIGGDGLIARSLGHFDAADYQRQLERGPGGAPRSSR